MHVDFSGLAVALATPFHDDGSVDLDGYRRLVRHVAGGGADVLVPLGSTGEAATIHPAERDAVIAACLEESAGKPVLVGTGANDTHHAAAMTARAQELGAIGALVVSPYYNKPPVRGLAAHYAAIAAAAPGFPLVAYNVPGRTGQNITADALDVIWENPQVVGLKESSGNLGQMAEIARRLPAGKQLLCGDDYMALAAIAVGAVGLVSVMGNLAPADAKALVDAARSGRLDEARAHQVRLLPLMDALFVESNPIPVKAGLKLLGLAGDGVRLPLVKAEPSTRTRLAAALEAAGVTLAT